MASETDTTILYGSQTGNAEDMSKRIGYTAKSLGYRVFVAAMDDFSLKLLPKQKRIIFVCSTTGHGQEPENMKNLYNFMRRRDLPKDCLKNLKFSVYGLGDSSYAKFNYVSKILYKRLKDCGAQVIQDLVLGDEQHPLGCDGVIYPGLDELWSKMGEMSSIERLTNKSPDNQLPQSSYSASFLNSGPVPNDEFKDSFISKYSMKTAYCTLNERLTPITHFQDTRFLSFMSEDEIEYEPGDVCTILPANLKENIQLFFEIIKLDPNQRFSLRKKDKNYMVNYLYDYIPDGLTILDLITYYLDIQSVPRRSFFEFLWPFSDDPLERDKLKEFSTTEGQEEMYEYCVQPKRTIIEVLQDFPNTTRNIKFEYLFDLVPPIKPRSFSIASSFSKHPGEIQLIVGVVNYQSRLRKIRKGLCSNYLASIKTLEESHGNRRESRLRFFIRKSSFKLPKSGQSQVLLIGPGLGIAPFRSFIEELSLRDGQKPAHLYFGCRFRDADFYFKDELKRYDSEGIIRLRTAFSREDRKQYVQDLLLEDSELIKNVLRDEEAVIYVAGNSKLPEDLRTLFEKVVNSNTGDSEPSIEGLKFISSLEAQNRIQYDCW